MLTTVQPLSELHPHLINLCLYECDLRATVGGTLSIHVPEEWAVRHGSLSVGSETNSCIYVLCFSEGTIDLCWMYSQKGSHKSRCFIYIVCMTINRLILVFLVRGWILLQSLLWACGDITVELGKFSKCDSSQPTNNSEGENFFSSFGVTNLTVNQSLRTKQMVGCLIFN